MRNVLFGASALLGACVSAPGLAQGAEGTDSASARLVIVGGGLSDTNTDVWGAFAESLAETGPVVIVPSASGSPVESADAVRTVLAGLGVNRERIVTAQLAVMDDRSTPDVDESRWARNGEDADLAALIRSAAGVWFTGGDQSRTLEVLVRDDEETPVLAALRASADRGVVIGGTSAGAAIMSDPMILQGDALTALTSSTEGEALGVGQGIGFFPGVIVDQHFGERARLGRLVVALASVADPKKRLGFGVDEDTALILTADGGLTVEGRGYVTVIDGRSARFVRTESGAYRVSGLTVHLLSDGDRLDGETLALTPADWRKATVGSEYFENAKPGGGGMALAGQGLADVLGDGLLDNAEADRVERISFDSTGIGVAFVFTQLRQSAGFWGRGADGEARYSIANVRFDIVPVRLTLETLD